MVLLFDCFTRLIWLLHSLWNDMYPLRQPIDFTDPHLTDGWDWRLREDATWTSGKSHSTPMEKDNMSFQQPGEWPFSFRGMYFGRCSIVVLFTVLLSVYVCVFMIWVFMSHIDLYTYIIYRSTALLWKHHDLHIKVNMETPIVNSLTWRSNSEGFPTWPSHWVVGPSCSSEIGTVWWVLYL